MKSEVTERTERLWKSIADDYERNAATYKPKNTWDNSHYNSPLNPLYYDSTKEIYTGWQEYINCNKKIPKENEKLKKLYTNLRSYVYRTVKQEKERQMRDVITAYVNNNIAPILEEWGIKKGYNDSFKVVNSNKLMMRILTEYVLPQLEAAGLHGVKIKNPKRVTPNSYELFDFTDVTFSTDKTKEE